MTVNEQRKLNSLIELVQLYEAANNNEKNDLRININNIAGFEVSDNELSNYDSSQSLEEFCNLLAIDKVSVDATKQEVLDFVRELSDEKDPDKLVYFLYKYEEAIEFFYKKPSGTISDLLFWSEAESYDEYIKELGSNKKRVILL